MAPSHALTGGLQLAYYVTGDRGLRDVVVAAAEHWIAEQEQAGTGWYATNDPSRQNNRYTRDAEPNDGCENRATGIVRNRRQRGSFQEGTTRENDRFATSWHFHNTETSL